MFLLHGDGRISYTSNRCRFIMVRSYGSLQVIACAFHALSSSTLSEPVSSRRSYLRFLSRNKTVCPRWHLPMPDDISVVRLQILVGTRTATSARSSARTSGKIESVAIKSRSPIFSSSRQGEIKWNHSLILQKRAWPSVKVAEEKRIEMSGIRPV